LKLDSAKKVLKQGLARVSISMRIRAELHGHHRARKRKISF